MKVELVYFDWEEPDPTIPVEKRSEPLPEIWDLEDMNKIYMLVLGFGNGTFVEVRARGDSKEAIEVFKGIAIGTGRVAPKDPTDEEKAKLWLWKPGYECYRQPRAAWVYVWPEPVEI